MAEIATLGATGRTVADNVRRLRERQRLTFADLDRTLEGLGNPIRPLGLKRIETYERRVDADDLVALAIALGTCPAALLMPEAESASEKVKATGVGRVVVQARELWDWLTAVAPFNPNVDAREFRFRSVPQWADEKG
jgi:hypothetical protein